MIKLKWKLETTPNGREVRVSSFVGTLLNVSKNMFSYVNKDKETLNYHLSTVSFKDMNDQEITTDQVVIYDTSFDKGMQVGSTYLGKITQGLEDLVDEETGVISKPKPWIMLSSFVKGQELSFNSFDFSDMD